MRLIDADKLLENIERRIKGAKSLAEVVDLTMIECITDVQHSVPAVPLDRIKAVREEIADWDVNTVMDGCSEPFRLGVAKGLDIASVILDKLIAESEG